MRYIGERNAGENSHAHLTTLPTWKGKYRSLGVRFFETKKESGRQIKVGMDDARRTFETWYAVIQAIQEWQPAVVGIEAYAVRTPKGVDALRGAAERLVAVGVPPTREAFADRLLRDDRYAAQYIDALGGLAACTRDQDAFAGVGLGNAAKTILVWGVVMGAAYAAGVPVYIFTATDLHRRLTGRADSSKEAIGEALEANVADLAAHAGMISPSKRNHVHDAAGHAVMALDELVKYRRALGQANTPGPWEPIALGCDPGFAKTGLAAVQLLEGR